MSKKKNKLESFISSNLKNYCDFFEKNNLVELKIDSDDVKVTLKKENLETQSAPGSVKVPSSIPVKNTEKKEEILEEPETKQHYKEIKSPIVGTFYQSLAPGEKPCVKIGDKVDTSNVVCIIESMKVMNQIKSGISGEITDILVKDGDNVKVGQVIMLLK